MTLLTSRRRAVTAAAAMVGAAVCLALPSSALAVGATSSTTVAGAALDSLGLVVATPASVLTPIQPGATATSTGIVTVTSTSTSSWTLSVNDQSTASTSGDPVAAGTGCTGSAATLPTLGVTASGTGVTSSGQVSLTRNAQQIASGPSGLPVAVTTSFSDVIPASTALVSGCAYSLTAVFTASAS